MVDVRTESDLNVAKQSGRKAQRTGAVKMCVQLLEA
jgi:hypothetical protein